MSSQIEQFSTNEINYTRYRRAKNTLRLNNYTPYNTLIQRPSMKHQRNISERASIKKSGKRNFNLYSNQRNIFSHSIRSFGSPSASKRNSISTMDNNLTFHVSSRSRFGFATISSVQPKKKKKDRKHFLPPPFIFIISSVSSNTRPSPGEMKGKKIKLRNS